MFVQDQPKSDRRHFLIMIVGDEACGGRSYKQHGRHRPCALFCDHGHPWANPLGIQCESNATATPYLSFPPNSSHTDCLLLFP